MAVAVRSPSSADGWSRLALLAAALALPLAGCARPAPPLAPDMSSLPAIERLLPEDRASSDAALDCAQLAQEIAHTGEATRALEATLHGERGSNQAKVYVGALFLVPLIATAEQGTGEKEQLDRLQARSDRLHRLSAAKACPSPAVRRP